MRAQYPSASKLYPTGAALVNTWDARRPREGESYGANVRKLCAGVQLELAGWPAGTVTVSDPYLDVPGCGWGDTIKIVLPAINETCTLDWQAPGAELLPAMQEHFDYGYLAHLWLGTKKLGAFSYQAFNAAEPGTILLDRPVGELWAHFLLTIDTRQGAGSFSMQPPCPVTGGGVYLNLFAATDWDEENEYFNEWHPLFMTTGIGAELLPFAFEKTPRAYACKTEAEWTADPSGFAWRHAASWCSGGSVKVLLMK